MATTIEERCQCDKVRNASALYGFGVVVTQLEMRQNGIGRGRISIQSCVVNCQGDKHAAARRETLLSPWNILNIPLAREFVISKLFLYVKLHLKIVSLGKRLPIIKFPNLQLENSYTFSIQ